MSSSDFFRKFQPLFEAKEEAKDDKKKGFFQNKNIPKEDNLEDPPEEVKVEGKEKKVKESKAVNATNTRATGAEFFRKYSDIIKEAEEQEVKEGWDDGDYDDDEDPDVKKADAVKGKDGKTQKDADKKKPAWLDKKLDKADKKDQDKGAKALKKDKDALKDSKQPRRPMIK